MLVIAGLARGFSSHSSSRSSYPPPRAPSEETRRLIEPFRQRREALPPEPFWRVAPESIPLPPSRTVAEVGEDLPPPGNCLPTDQ